MNQMGAFLPWVPTALAKGQLDDRRWAYLIEAPYDMPAHLPDLIGTCVDLEGRTYEIRGTLPRIPEGAVRKGELLGILVMDRTPV